MKTIEYRIKYTYGSYDENVRVRARDINSGFTKALKLARRLHDGREREIASVEFWAVV